MFSALVGNKPQFVSLLLENGVSLRDFLQEEDTLSELYKKLPPCLFLNKLAKRVHAPRRSKKPGFFRSRPHHEQGISMTYVSDEVRHLLGSFTKHLYPPIRTCDFNMSMEDSPSSVSLLIYSSLP